MAQQSRCVFLAGPSSAGKTSLALAFQHITDEPWFFLEGDRLSGGFPSNRPEFVTLEWDRRVREACARAARGILEAGLGVIVELGLFDPWGRAKLATLFAGFPTFVVRVSCDLGTLEQRERARGDRHVGTARRQWEQLEGIPFDHELVTDSAPPEQLAHNLVRWLASDPVPQALHQLRQGREAAAAVSVRELELADAPVCDAVMATLPYFFGQPAGIAECAAAVRSQPGLVAVDRSGNVVGFLTYRLHHANSAEITWMAVRQDTRRQGVGRLLIDVVEAHLWRRGVRLVFVITLGPSVDEPGVTDGYGGTRAFYESTGFIPLRELDAWGPDSPGLILARPTTPGGPAGAESAPLGARAC